MKKNLYTILTSVIVLFLFTGCNDEFLDRYPLDSLNDANFWQEKETSVLAANACYDWINKANTLDLEYLSDNNLYFSNNQYLETISSGMHNAYDGNVNNLWVANYAAIRRCNHFLENYEKGNFDPELKKRLGAEVRFLRAYYYGQLITFFGDVQLITKTLAPGDPELYGTRQPKAQILEFVLTELQNAANELPPSYTESADHGRATKGAALSIKARIALFNEKWDVAEKAAKDVMELGYELYKEGGQAHAYNQLFRHAGKPSTNLNNKEDIFWRPYLFQKVHHNLSRELQLPTTRTDEYVRWSPTKSLADAYLCTDGLPIDRSNLYKGAPKANATYADYWVNRDPRMRQTIIGPGDLWIGTHPYSVPFFPGNSGVPMTRTGFYFTKYCELNNPNAQGYGECVANYNYDWNDIRIIRYAEVLLTYAEAKMEQGTLTQAVVDETINLMRDRVGMKWMDLAELQANGLEVRNEIRRERRVELALEGIRYFDLLRWKQGDLLAAPKKGISKEIVNKEWGGGWQDKFVKDFEVDGNGDMIIQKDRQFNMAKDYLWPVPAEQLRLNANLGKNPGW